MLQFSEKTLEIDIPVWAQAASDCAEEVPQAPKKIQKAKLSGARGISLAQSDVDCAQTRMHVYMQYILYLFLFLFAMKCEESTT